METEMDASPERTIRKFNPGIFQSDEEVIEQFVVRKKELGMALETLRDNIDSPSCQHTLIVAPRGRGKTMLLARIAAEMRTNNELSERLLPIRFMEESHEIFNMADFWLETLFHLAREVAACNSGVAQELRATHSDLTRRWRDDDLDQRARAAVLSATDRLRKQLVVMVENFQAMNDAVENRFGWKLRQVLQTEPQIMLLATATARFKGLDDVEQPFFELFRVIYLDPLDTEESRVLWQMASGDEVRTRAIRPLEILTGGDPRLLVIVAQFARQRSMRQLLQHVVSLVDDHTEYFRAHLEGLAKTERRVYLAVVDLWRPSTAGEVAARARMDIRAASSLLGRLVQRGAVAVDGAGKTRQYTCVQGLYSIYYKLRHEHDGAAVVEHMIDFMIAFYTTAELIDVPVVPGESAPARIANASEHGDLKEKSGVPFVWRSLWTKATALLRDQRADLAQNVFQGLYGAFDPANKDMLRDMALGVIQLVTNGMPERAALDILSIEQEKADALAPIVVALRQRQGEAVSAPAEVCAMAEDVRKEIESGYERRSYAVNHWLV